MNFISKYRNAAYVVKATTRIIYPGQGSAIQPGLRAVFKGDNRIFDSLQAQKQFGWSDEDRERVENHLLSHPDFGHGLYLAPGEKLPEEKQHLLKEIKPAVRKRCLNIVTQDGDIIQCPTEALPGEDFCTEHRPNVITKGMLSTKT